MGVSIDYTKCKPKCFLCQETCPHNVFWPSGTKTGEKVNRPEVRYPIDCNHCYMIWACERVCPTGAIKVKPTVAYKTWFPV